MTVIPDYYITHLSTNEGNLIRPFDESRVQPASYDVALGERFRVFTNQTVAHIDLDDPASYEKITREVDLTEEQGDLIAEPGFVLHPGEFVLGMTEEYVRIPNNMVARIEGKSSLGRLGLIVHATAGYIDPGYQGNITLEMTNLLRVPIILRPGKLIAQLSFQYLESTASKPYKGRYQGDTGPSSSRYGIEPEA